MLNPISESVVRTTTRADNHFVQENKDAALEKTAKVTEERAIEDSEESKKSNLANERDLSGYDVDDEGLYFEKYDKKGNVVYRLPPEKKPIDEIV